MTKFSGESIIFDSSAVMRFSDNRKGADLVGSFLESSMNNKTSAFISSLSVLEFVSLVGGRDYKMACTPLELLKRSNVKILPATESVCLRAAGLRIKYGSSKISTADWIIIATSLENNSRLITGDKEWPKINEARVTVI